MPKHNHFICTFAANSTAISQPPPRKINHPTAVVQTARQMGNESNIGLTSPLAESDGPIAPIARNRMTSIIGQHKKREKKTPNKGETVCALSAFDSRP